MNECIKAAFEKGGDLGVLNVPDTFIIKEKGGDKEFWKTSFGNIVVGGWVDTPLVCASSFLVCSSFGFLMASAVGKEVS